MSYDDKTIKARDYPQAQTSERERLVTYARKAVQCLYIAVEECVARDCSAAVNAALDADAEKIRALEAALQTIVATKPVIVMDGNAIVGDGNAIGWNVHQIARRALAATQSPRSEAGEDVK